MNSFLKCSRLLRLKLHSHCQSIVAQNTACISELASHNGRTEAVVSTDDGKIIVCWHPQPSFPYKFTKPLPQKAKCDNPLKSLKNVGEVFKRKHPFYERQKLVEATFTSRRTWFTRGNRTQYARRHRQEPKDREYL